MIPSVQLAGKVSVSTGGSKAQSSRRKCRNAVFQELKVPSNVPHESCGKGEFFDLEIPATGYLAFPRVQILYFHCPLSILEEGGWV